MYEPQIEAQFPSMLQIAMADERLTIGRMKELAIQATIIWKAGTAPIGICEGAIVSTCKTAKGLNTYKVHAEHSCAEVGTACHNGIADSRYKQHGHDVNASVASAASSPCSQDGCAPCHKPNWYLLMVSSKFRMTGIRLRRTNREQQCGNVIVVQSLHDRGEKVLECHSED